MKTDLWSPSMMFTNVKTPPKAKNLKKNTPKIAKNPKKGQKTQKMLFFSQLPKKYFDFLGNC